jgi:hypothetical protein
VKCNRCRAVDVAPGFDRCAPCRDAVAQKRRERIEKVARELKDERVGQQSQRQSRRQKGVRKGPYKARVVPDTPPIEPVQNQDERYLLTLRERLQELIELQ